VGSRCGGRRLKKGVRAKKKGGEAYKLISRDNKKVKECFKTGRRYKSRGARNRGHYKKTATKQKLTILFVKEGPKNLVCCCILGIREKPMDLDSVKNDI